MSKVQIKLKKCFFIFDKISENQENIIIWIISLCKRELIKKWKLYIEQAFIIISIII